MSGQLKARRLLALLPQPVLRLAFVIPAALVIMITGVAASLPYIENLVNRPVATVKVSGQFTRISAREVRAQLSAVTTGRLFSLDLDRAGQVLRQMPWVEHAQIRRVWPDALQIRVYERIPAGRWNDSALFDTAGHVFVPESRAPYRDLPHLQGESGAARKVWQYFSGARAQLAPLPAEVTGLTIDKDGNRIVYVARVPVNTGNCCWKARMARFARLYRQHLAGQWSRISRVDMRYANGAAVTL